jgi:hypothetical protein
MYFYFSWSLCLQQTQMGSYFSSYPPRMNATQKVYLLSAPIPHHYIRLRPKCYKNTCLPSRLPYLQSLSHSRFSSAAHIFTHLTLNYNHGLHQDQHRQRHFSVFF